jgi:hypothetical protein
MLRFFLNILENATRQYQGYFQAMIANLRSWKNVHEPVWTQKIGSVSNFTIAGFCFTVKHLGDRIS